MELDIRNINTYVISLPNANDRREKMKSLLSKLGIKKWSFFDAIDVRGKLPYWIGCGMSHREVLAQASYPCIVYEDDIDTTSWYKPTITVPNEKIVYLGISKWGTKSGVSDVNGAKFFETDYDGILGVQSMVSGHAIYYPNRKEASKYGNGITKQLLENLRPMDEWFADVQTKNEVYCLQQPMFYQKCDKNEIWTNFEVDRNDIIS